MMIWPMYKTVQYQSKTGNSSIYLSFFAYDGTFTNTFSSGIPIHYGVSVYYDFIHSRYSEIEIAIARI
jgi:hypothetical protein